MNPGETSKKKQAVVPSDTDGAQPIENDQPIVVAIGASAGGVEALEALFSLMPDDLNAIFVVVQHLASDHESMMPQILMRKTDLPVLSIENDALLLPRHVFVLPSGKDLQVHNGKFVLSATGGNRSHHPIDLLFDSVADEYGKNAVAIILSGTGTDGAAGVKEIHRKGGFVIVQNEQSAKFNGMPRASVATGVVDSIVSLEEIPDTLAKYARLPNGDIPRRKLFLKEQDVESQIKMLLHRRFQVDFNLYKTSMIDRRLARRIKLVGSDSTESYLQQLENDPVELAGLFSDLLIEVTEFFRDAEVFEDLRQFVLPSLLNSALPSGQLRIWVCPCSTGEEAYSIAMLIDSLIRDGDYKIDFKVFATDVNPEVIEFASQGEYEDSQLQNVSKRFIEEYFDRFGNQMQICRDLRKKVIFARHDVLQDAPFTKLDMICCRNLLIYFKSDTQKKVLSLFNFGLKDSGLLLLGPSESLGSLEQEFSPVSEQSNTHRKTGRIRISEIGAGNQAATISANIANRLPSPASSLDADVDLARSYDCMLDRFVPSGFLVDREGHVLHIFGDAAGYFSVSSGRTGDSLITQLSPSIRETVTIGLKQVEVMPGQVFQSTIQNENEFCLIRVEALENDPLGRKFVSIEKTLNPATDASGTAVPDKVRDSDVLKKLKNTEQQLHESALNFKTLNEELQATNEELVASNEELQSTNEELRSVNEELCSVNSEHQRKISELTELTDDMDNLLDGIQVDTIFLDQELRIRKFNLGLAKIFDLVPHDIGRRFDRLVHGLKNVSLIEEIEKVRDTRTRIEKEVQSENDNWYLLRILPYNSGDSVDGVLLTFIDIDRIKQTELRLSELSDVVLFSDDAIFKTTPDGLIETWNRGAETLFLHTPNSIVGKHVCDLAGDDIGRQGIKDSLSRIKMGARIDHLEMKAVRRNGETVDVQMSASPIFDATKRVVAASIVMRDFSRQKEAEHANQLAVQQRDQFLAMLSHELRNPIAAIMSALGVLRISGDETNRESARKTIDGHSRQLAKLLDDLLDVSRITHDKINLTLENTDFVELTRKAVECVEARVLEKDQVLGLELPTSPMMVYADATRILQAQVNILVNATKYTPACGRIKVSAFAEDEFAVLKVQDDGVGIEGELIENIFNVFVQADQSLDRQEGGMGLGLPLVKMIAKAHGGFVSAASQGEGKGSQFTFKIPQSTASMATSKDTSTEHLAAAQKTVIQNNNPEKNLSVLLVEDNASTRNMIKIYFECHDIQVFEATNGIDGINSYTKNLPTVCVVDIGLPDCDGFQVAKQIRANEKQPSALIAMTGYGSAQDVADATQAGFDLHLVKPVDPEELMTAIHRIVKQRSSAAMTQS